MADTLTGCKRDCARQSEIYTPTFINASQSQSSCTFSIPKSLTNLRHLTVITTYPSILVNQLIINHRGIFAPFALQTKIAVLEEV